MPKRWRSKETYQHPSDDLPNTRGYVEMTTNGIYVFKHGASRMSCPRAWAAKIHYAEEKKITPQGRPSIGDATFPAITLREDIRAAFKDKARALGLSIPDARRQAYRLLIDTQEQEEDNA